MDINTINRKDNWGDTALIEAIKTQNESIAEQILNLEGVDADSVDRQGKTCLIWASDLTWASEDGLDKIVQKLLPKLTINQVNKRDYRGDTALLLAIRRQNVTMAEELLNLEGIEVNAVGVLNTTCLIWAIKHRYDQIIQKLWPKLTMTNINIRTLSKVKHR